MKSIAGFVKQYFLETNKTVLFSVAILLGGLIWCNYHFRLYAYFQDDASLLLRFLRYYGLYGAIFWSVWLLTFLIGRTPVPFNLWFYIFGVISPGIFALKISIKTTDLVEPVHYQPQWDRYFNIVLQWPIKAAIVIFCVILLWLIARLKQPVAGLSLGKMVWKPYFFLLAMMLPFLLLASETPSFMQVYPKLTLISFILDGAPWNLWSIAFFELCYGIDFFTIELFFRGFLILGFVRFAGKDAILPAATFYCAIHFGKPPVECVSSFFGGLILGAIVRQTGSIWGGLVIHLGIAWMMELIGIM